MQYRISLSPRDTYLARAQAHPYLGTSRSAGYGSAARAATHTASAPHTMQCAHRPRHAGISAHQPLAWPTEALTENMTRLHWYLRLDAN